MIDRVQGLGPGRTQILDGLVDGDDVGKGRPRENPERVIDVIGFPHPVQHATHARRAGQHPKRFAGETLTPPLGRDEGIDRRRNRRALLLAHGGRLPAEFA